MPWRYCIGFNYILKSRLRGSCVEHNMHGVMRIGKRVNGKVMNYDLRDLDNEMIECLEFSAT